MYLALAKMLVRQVLRSARKIPARTLSSGRMDIDLKIDDEGIAVMNFQRTPVNCYNLEFLQTICNNLDDLSKNEKYKGLIMTSAIPNIFSAGIDLNELHKPDPERLSTFYRAMTDTFLKLYGSEVTTTVAINGFTAAGGAVVSFMCDYRVMVNDRSTLGMNDTVVGIIPMWLIFETMKQIMGSRQAEIAITTSKMYTPEEALKAQMIDEIAVNKEDAIEKCKKFIRQYDNIPKNILSIVKKQLRDSVIRGVEENQERDVQTFINNIMNPYAQEQIGNFVKQLKLKKAK